jgi:hypothetical protein
LQVVRPREGRGGAAARGAMVRVSGNAKAGVGNFYISALKPCATGLVLGMQ